MGLRGPTENHIKCSTRGLCDFMYKLTIHAGPFSLQLHTPGSLLIKALKDLTYISFRHSWYVQGVIPDFCGPRNFNGWLHAGLGALYTRIKGYITWFYAWGSRLRFAAGVHFATAWVRTSICQFWHQSFEARTAWVIDRAFKHEVYVCTHADKCFSWPRDLVNNHL